MLPGTKLNDGDGLWAEAGSTVMWQPLWADSSGEIDKVGDAASVCPTTLAHVTQFGVLSSTNLAANHICTLHAELGSDRFCTQTVECKASERQEVAMRVALG